MDIKDLMEKIKKYIEPEKQKTSGLAYVFWLASRNPGEQKHGELRAAPAEALFGPKASLLLQISALSDGTAIFGPFPAYDKRDAIRAFGAWVEECASKGISVFTQDKYIPRERVRLVVMEAVAAGDTRVSEILARGTQDTDIREDALEAVRRYETNSGEPCKNCGEIHDDEPGNIEVKVVTIPLGPEPGVPGLPFIPSNETKDFGPN